MQLLKTGLDEIVPAPASTPAPAPEAAAPAAEVVAPTPAAEVVAPARADRRGYLKALWGEAMRLTPRQRTVFLLGFRDSQGRGAIGLLPITGVAGLRSIAAAIGMTPVELATIWKDLPLDDAAMAARLGTTTLQIGDLRRAARERVAVRMRRR